MPGFPGCASSASASARACISGPSTGGTSRPGNRPSPRSIPRCGRAASPTTRVAPAISTTLSVSPPGSHGADRDGGLAAFLKPDLPPRERALGAGGGLDSRRSRLDPSADWSGSAKSSGPCGPAAAGAKNRRITDNEGVPEVRCLCFGAELGAGSMCTGKRFTTISCLTKTDGRLSRLDENHPKHRHGAAPRLMSATLVRSQPQSAD